MGYLILLLVFAGIALFTINISGWLAAGISVLGIIVVGSLIYRKRNSTTSSSTTPPPTKPKKSSNNPHPIVYVFSLIIIGLFVWGAIEITPPATSCAKSCFTEIGGAWDNFNVASTQRRPHNTMKKNLWWEGPVNPGTIVEVGEISYNSKPRHNNCYSIYIDFSAVQHHVYDPTTGKATKWDEVSLDNNGQEYCMLPGKTGMLRLSIPSDGVTEHVKVYSYKSRQ